MAVIGSGRKLSGTLIDGRGLELFESIVRDWKLLKKIMTIYILNALWSETQLKGVLI